MWRVKLSLIVVLLSTAAVPQESTDETWRFEGVEMVSLFGTSGDLAVRAGSDTQVGLRLFTDVDPPGAFRAEVEQRGSTLVLREDWSGRSDGRVHWTLTVPPSVRLSVEMRSSSGDVFAESVPVRFQVRTSSGDFEMRDATLVAGSRIETSSGDLDLRGVVIEENGRIATSSGDVVIDDVSAEEDFRFSTSSGDVRISGSHGILEGSSSSGDVRVEETSLDGPSSFSSSSGDVTVNLAALPEHDIELSSSSGDVDLLVGSLGSDFTLVVSKREDRGRIDSPLQFTSRTTFRRSGQVYEERTLSRGDGKPEVALRTASGTVSVRERP